MDSALFGATLGLCNRKALPPACAAAAIDSASSATASVRGDGRSGLVSAMKYLQSARNAITSARQTSGSHIDRRMAHHRRQPQPVKAGEDVTMLMLIVGLMLFLGAHSIAVVAPGWRNRVVMHLRERSWKGAYSLISAAGLV